jgi:flavoprotein
MKKLIVLFTAILISAGAMAQMIPIATDLPAPFKGGTAAMKVFFRDSLQVTPAIQQIKATGMVIFKFTADAKGSISKMVVYYADDLVLTEPVIDALKRTNGKWVIPVDHKVYDFIIPFSINYKPATAPKAAALKAILDYAQNKKPIIAADQVPLNAATLLPTVVINY